MSASITAEVILLPIEVGVKFLLPDLNPKSHKSNEVNCLFLRLSSQRLDSTSPILKADLVFDRLEL